MAIMGKNWVMIYGPKTERILAGVLTVASGGWLILILLGYLESLGWGHILGLFVLFGIGVASLLTGKKTDMSHNGTHFTFRVATWTRESIVKHVARVEDYEVALATTTPPADGGATLPSPWEALGPSHLGKLGYA
jgi:hypothetical protein